MWVESDSMYIVNLFNNGVGKIPWHHRNKWLGTVMTSKKIVVVMSHIFREGNCVADTLALR